MSRIKYAMAAALAAHLETAAPALAGRAKAIQQPPQALADYPTAAVLPGRFTLNWSSTLEDVVDENDEAVLDSDGNALACAGTIDGTVQIWIAAEYPADRENLEGRILSSFITAETRGSIGLTVDRAMYAPDSGETLEASVYLDSEAWREEMVFSERRWAILDCLVSIPIVVPLDADLYPVVDELKMSITQDMDDVSGAATPEIALAALDNVETYNIAADGSYTED